MARIDYQSYVGQIKISEKWGPYKVLEYQGRNEKKIHFYKIKFKNTGNEEQVRFNHIRENKVKDSRLAKLNKQIATQKWLKNKTRLVKKSVASFSTVGLEKTRLLAVDLATEKIGVSFWNHGKHVGSKEIHETDEDHAIRSYKIAKELRALIIRNDIKAVAIENIYLGMNSTVFEKLAQVRGMVLYNLLDLKIRVEVIPINSWKSKTLKTHGRENQKAESIARFNVETGKKTNSDDVADAYNIGKFCVNF